MINPTLILNETAAAPADGKVYGIHTATRGFLDAFLDDDQVTELLYHPASDAVRSAVAERAALRRRPIVLKEARSQDDVPQSAMSYAIPQADQFWSRAAHGSGRYSICGIHHSLTGHEIHKQMRDLILAPTEAWDALICTSRAGRTVIERMFEGWSNHVASRGGHLPMSRLQLPVIPLGIVTEEFGPRPQTPSIRADLRRRLGIPEKDLVVLFLGRLNFSSKAHPVSMFMALERARASVGRDIHLVQAGWYPSDEVEAATLRLANATALRCACTTSAPKPPPNEAAPSRSPTSSCRWRTTSRKALG